ncbi:hypothetical protein M427DRAFT_55474 [Gonapodya prolifera JEL478]|uniref:Uncharacterized protein n=1 Tax=Gonapodya prolifera (strain JEL478) TaxID=1344416 RepID=A0A139AIZ7_GONPJ|nr:hypothetical protein M427DRAFT_55474 [Gonapodya prolifera JEL478]|eukprot:KXS16524.1 hypothetical protein M427DRAFT_55474 [Gonapodya prolifera JEL478]
MAAAILPDALFALICPTPRDSLVRLAGSSSQSPPDCSAQAVQTVLYTAVFCALLAYAYVSYLNTKILKWRKLAANKDQELKDRFGSGGAKGSIPGFGSLDSLRRENVLLSSQVVELEEKVVALKKELGLRSSSTETFTPMPAI